MKNTNFTFEEAVGCREAQKIREFKTNDIVVRLGVISPNRVHLNNYPIDNPITVFNPSMYYDEKEEILHLYARIILGYYMYVSNIIRIDVPISDTHNGSMNTNHYTGEIVVYPSCRYDFWGAEDPRVYSIDGELYMTYTGRTINYFNPAIRKNRTLPVTTIYDKDLKVWRKKLVFTLSPKVFGEPISNKDAFIYKCEGGELIVFHRPHLEDESFRLMVSKTSNLRVIRESLEIRSVELDNAIEVLKNANFEERIGWATPPITITSRRVIVLLHGVDNEIKAYRVFAVELSLCKEGVIVEAVTPHYIMEPKTSFEIIGDRPLVVFPCGVVKIGKDEVLISYGAADYMVGIGFISLNELLGELDKGRLY